MDEKEAIKILNRRINQLRLKFAITNEDLEAIETALNLLEKKDTLIHTMQSEFERLEDLEDNTDMLKMELEKKDIDIIEAKEANRQLSVELQKKDKIIDLIAGELANYKHEEIICMEVDCKHIELQNEGKCIGDKECIKEYYERKVENGN